jgi:SAM-dependent methyltransferase
VPAAKESWNMSTDRTWEYFGRTDPYWGVLTNPEFKGGLNSEAAREQFFGTGRDYIESVLKMVREHLDPTFRPTRALDFGCGVGRLAIPLASICESVVGVDISDSMLAEARKNAAEQGKSNVTFVKSDDQLSAATGTFDFINSMIVFQHIPTARGEGIFKAMIERLREGGVGAVQFTYGFDSGTSTARRLLSDAYAHVPLLWGARNLIKGRPFSEPMMQMNRYDLNRLLRILQESGCHLVHVRFTETGSFGRAMFGAVLLFQKKLLDVAAHS